MIFRLILSSLLFCISVTLGSSQGYFGKILSSNGESPVVGAEVSIVDTDMLVVTNASGIYRFPNLQSGSYTLSVVAEEFESKFEALTPENYNVEQIINLVSGTRNYSVIQGISTISEFNLLDDSDSQVSSLLSASRDPFNNAAAFNLNAARFRVRGYESELNSTYVNGIKFNTLNGGRVFHGTWGGLNDLFRLRDETEGLQPSGFAMSGIGGASNIDIRASKQRKQMKASYSLANTSYTNRVMLTYGSGLNANGWAFAGGLSRRWAQEGYVSGTFYDSYSGFFGVEKQFSNTQSIGFSVFNVQGASGRASASTQEAYDLAGDNFYNPNWGYLNGEKRNPRQYRNNLLTSILRYDHRLDNRAQIVASLGYQTGKDGTSGIDWYNAPDPRPDYYRNLPSYSEIPEVQELGREYILANPEVLQLNLERMYAINSQSLTTIKSVDGISGNDITGNLAAYKIEEQRYDPTKIFFNGNVSMPWTDKLTTISGISYTNEIIDNYKIVDDLLGADFAIDWDNFADGSGDQSLEIDPAKQNNVFTPNNTLYPGDVFGFHYKMYHHNAGAWTNIEYSLKKLDIFAGGEVESTTFWRDGIFKNGIFPNDSYGEGEHKTFVTGTAKAGATYKFSGRMYAYGTAAYMTRSPYSRNSYITPRTRSTVIDDLQVENISAGELGFVARFPRLKGRASVYYTDMKNQYETRNVYFDELNQFGNLILTGIDTRHAGIEIGTEIQLTSTIYTNIALALGEHIYTSDPTVKVAVDDLVDIETIGKTYYKNHYVSGGPQTAGTIQLGYNSPKFWTISVNANYFDRSYISMSPTRRTEDIIKKVIEPQLANLSAIDATSATPAFLETEIYNNPITTALIDDIYGQEKYPSAMTFDIFARKSWRVKGKFIALNASVNNITNNSFRSGGFEQLRLNYRGSFSETGDFQLQNLFPPRYYYAYGTTYFLTLSLSL